MFFSLVQTLVCVLLIQGGLYALHLSGNNGGLNGANLGNSGSSISISNGNSRSSSSSSSGGGGGSNNNGGIPNSHVLHVLGAGNAQTHAQHLPINVALHKEQQQHHHQQQLQQQHHHQQQQQQQQHIKSNSGRLAEEIADFAQMERERLMLMDLAKQTAAAVNAASTVHHGRPIITGRIQMTPAEDIDAASVDYPGAILPQSQQPQRNYMFGSVVKQAPRQSDDYDSGEEFDGGGRFAMHRRPIKYEYGRVVQPSDHEFDPQHMDMDGFMELEVAEPDVEEIIPDLDGYQYWDELLPEQHKEFNEDAALPFGGYAHHRYPQNPYQTLEELESSPPQALQELFDKERELERERERVRERKHEREREREYEREQHDAPIVSVAAKGHKELLGKTRNAGGTTGNGFNIRLQQKWQRKRNQQQQPQPQLQRNIFGGHQKHHFNSLQHAKFSLANSEATATKHIGIGKNAASSSSDIDAAISQEAAIKTNSQKQQSNSNNQDDNSKLSVDDDTLATSSKSSSSSSPSSPSSSSSLLSSPSASASATNNNNDRIDGAATATMAVKEHLLQSNHKRSGAMGGSYGSGLQPPPVAHSIASQLMLRTARGQRQYDVPQIECPTAMDGMERFACPTPDLQGRYRCIDDHVLCDGFIDCPEGEDEDRRSCMFYKTTKAHLDVLADALLRWARGR